MTAHVRSSGALSAAFRFGEFTFDFESRQLLRDGVPQHLSPKAQHLLHHLLLARPRALSREDLYDLLWPSTFVSEGNLASVVNEVRRALGDDARSPRYIRTAHGFGYAFCGDLAMSAPIVSATAMLRCEGSAGSETTNYLLYEGQNAVGRALDGQVVIPGPTVSRRHALITVSHGTLTIEDLDSKNGTYVDGRKIGRTPVPVKPHSRIMFGTVAAYIMTRRSSATQSVRVDSDQHIA